jgi:hypothetical protein
MQFTLRDCRPGSIGALLVSRPQLPVALGRGAYAYVHTGDFAVLGGFVTGARGRATFTLPLDPVLLSLEGTILASQVVLAPSAAPLGFDLTNGLHWKLGR